MSAMEPRHRATNDKDATVITLAVFICESETPEQESCYEGGYQPSLTSEETCERKYANAGGNCDSNTSP
jgi:hypothetical protein